MSVLFGIFLYMGISSTNGIQFFERLKLFFMPVKHHPQAAYVRKVSTMHISLIKTPMKINFTNSILSHIRQCWRSIIFKFGYFKPFSSRFTSTSDSIPME
jgi:hypothetical protein